MLCAPLALAQTFEINGQQSQPSRHFAEWRATAGEEERTSGAENASSDNGIGWGSSIEVGRLARAAEDALRRGNPAGAADYAQRAVKAAPQRQQALVSAGLHLAPGGTLSDSRSMPISTDCRTAPGNADGMSGLAQTYAAWDAPTKPSACCCR